ncbi:hypothetical protein DVS28_b0524 (plasmid) [Euzebya pacifica]|uniref:Uncharacterized protein n=1 Tax=Euzebya pacifica TaxID=1608957 RepID=A0A346Y717_9ACTN|nr:hypothetical protein DVS28_b0524 [Euzebya pacifica]
MGARPQGALRPSPEAVEEGVFTRLEAVPGATDVMGELSDN